MRAFFTALLVAARAAAMSPVALPTPTPQHLPRWRGFNLLEKFTVEWGNKNAPFVEDDFAMISQWGFNFVRLPMDYRCWIEEGDWRRFNEKTLKEIDQAIELGKKYHIHVCLNFHRGPGYCVNPPKEPKDLWTDPEAQEVCALHWATFARRYKGLPNSRLSFDLLNEPNDMPNETYAKVARLLVAAIRKEDPERLIISDGTRWGNKPVPELADLRIAQSTRGYAPMQISHHKATWIHGSDAWPTPTWPLKLADGVWDRDRLQREQIEPWKKLEALGVGVHVGEWGAFVHTPHDVALAWMRDCLENWKKAGWGWALWNLRGGFGILDTDRPDVDYEDFRGHKLDRAMLNLLQRY
ncbi:MAG: cellulase family glycosylhydrolase [bacterium]